LAGDQLNDDPPDVVKQPTEPRKYIIPFIIPMTEVIMKVNIGTYKKNGTPRTQKIVIEKWDTWSLDATLAHIIHPALVQFRAVVQSHPADMTFKGWKTRLDKMIFAFGELTKDGSWEDQYVSGEVDWIVTELENGNTSWKSGPKSTFKVDRKGMAAHSKKIQDGLDLFAKHYRHLWN
jgi:hypothetical protein